jgi:hypothetical protein
MMQKPLGVFKYRETVEVEEEMETENDLHPDGPSQPMETLFPDLKQAHRSRCQ